MLPAPVILFIVPCVAHLYVHNNTEQVSRWDGEAQFPPNMNAEVGMQLMLSNDQGQQFPVVVAEVKEESVVLDANHPLAGQDLIFDIEMMEIQPTSRIIMP